jgi:hypothetical protein
MNLGRLVCVLVCLGTAVRGGESSQAADLFETRVRPILAKNCLPCHARDALGGLKLDSREHMLKGGTDGPVVVAWHPNESVLIQAVRREHPRFKMPPQGPLPAGDVETLVAWVKAGAIWPADASTLPQQNSNAYVITPEQRSFWSFQPVRKPPIPTVKEPGSCRNEIDRFILAKLEAKGLQPVKAADKRVLIRRATFDLIGLPPTPEEVDAFLADSSPDAFAKVVDRLLASPHYGERWARYWLDYARYADEKLTHAQGNFPGAFRYRDWVVKAFNDDMPFDLFVKAQIAGDLLNRPDRDKLLPGLGFYALSPGDEEDRVDVTTRVFLGLTVGCARCHDHKYDPIPTEDYYSLLGVFRSTEYQEIPLVAPDVAKHWDGLKKEIDTEKDTIADFAAAQSRQLSEILSYQVSRYLLASWKVLNDGADVKATATADNLDQETLDRWVRYLKDPEKEHPYLKPWYALLARHAGPDEVRKFADEFQALVLSFNAEKKAMDDRNYVKLGGAEGSKVESKRQYTNIETLEIKKYYLWRDLESEPYTREAVKFKGGVLYYGPKEIDRWLPGAWKGYLDAKRDHLAALQKALPPRYPFLHVIRDVEKPDDIRVEIRGEADNLGAVAPRRFLRIFYPGMPPGFKQGSGRLELAEAIADSRNPLTARVMANRIWQFHFGQGIVRTVDNFGKLGDPPSHPELLDYLASRFVESGWSVKALTREIMLSATYAFSSEEIAENTAVDPENRLLWRANVVQRLDAEALRDSLLAVAGNLDLTVGGPATRLTDDNRRRTLYALISRAKLDSTLDLFDFPNANITSEKRNLTVGPMQRLYFMNSNFVEMQARSFAERIKRGGDDDRARIALAYRILYQRYPTESETQLGETFLRDSGGAWQEYARVLLGSSEFSSVN